MAKLNLKARTTADLIAEVLREDIMEGREATGAAMRQAEDRRAFRR